MIRSVIKRFWEGEAEQACEEHLKIAGLPTDELIKAAAVLDTSVKNQAHRLRELKAEITKRADFKPGSKTGYLSGGDIRAKVQRRQNIIWQQNHLTRLRRQLGDPAFLGLFRIRYEPISRKLIENYMEQEQPAGVEALRSAMTVKSTAALVSFEPWSHEVGASTAEPSIRLSLGPDRDNGERD